MFYIIILCHCQF